MSDNDISLIAHLVRRAGFGATREELEAYAARGYDAMVEELLHPETVPDIEEDILSRYYGEQRLLPAQTGIWIYRMINSRRPLEEKMALFWHHVFATGFGKANHPPSIARHIAMFRRNGMSSLHKLLTDLSRDPAMIFWLDNSENHNGEPNENFGRELLELFSMGVGNYSEEDIKNAARAFTGWTFGQPIPIYPHGDFVTEFLYREDDHDDSVKTFLGETGRFNGEDIIEIIVRQPAAARFIARHLYNFFVADEPQVPAWNEMPPQDPVAIDALTKAYFDNDGEIRAMLQVLFTSDFFKEARFKRVKSPAELVVGIIKLTGVYRSPEKDIIRLGVATTVMGQELMNPPTVEGWHTGKEWIDGGALNERVNFAVNELNDLSQPGIKEIVARVSADGGSRRPEEFVDQCLDLAGPVEVSDETKSALRKYANSGGDLRFGTDADREESAARIARMLQLIVSSREYQFA